MVGASLFSSLCIFFLYIPLLAPHFFENLDSDLHFHFCWYGSKHDKSETTPNFRNYVAFHPNKVTGRHLGAKIIHNGICTLSSDRDKDLCNFCIFFNFFFSKHLSPEFLCKTKLVSIYNSKDSCGRSCFTSLLVVLQ